LTDVPIDQVWAVLVRWHVAAFQSVSYSGRQSSGYSQNPQSRRVDLQ